MSLRREGGFALLIVLWSLVLLALILTQLLSAGRTEAQRAGNLRASAVMEAVADGAIHAAAFHLMASGTQHWPTRGLHRVQIGRGSADISLEDAADKINPNTASPALLGALIGLCGVPSAPGLAQAIAAWRSADAPADAYLAARLPYGPPGLPFETLDEVGLVIGMTPPLLDCMRPHLSLYQEGSPGTHSADPVVVQALAIAAQGGDGPAGPGDSDGSQAVIVTATATLPQGGRFVRRATIRFGEKFKILTWD